MVATVDLSAWQYFLPLVSFLLVFVVVFAVLAKTKVIGESKWVQLLISFLVATVFVTVNSLRDFVIQITPWFGAFVVALALLLAVIGFAGDIDFLKKGAGIVFVIGLLVVFIVSGLSIFAPSEGNAFIDWIKAPRVYGAVILLVISAVVSWVLIKFK